MDIFNFIKSNVHILDVVNQYASLKKAGLYWKGHCPFHHEKTASFTVSPHREIFYCFGCSSGGDVITFITKVEQCTAIDAVKMLADRYNLDLPTDSKISHKSESADEKERYFKLCTMVANWCHEQLKKNNMAQKYLNARDISDKSITHFTIGFFPAGLIHVQALIHYAQKQQILAEDLVQANILSHTKNIFYSPFEGRILFPIKDHLGRFCGFGGRVFKESDDRAKYYNSKESTYFAKGSLLFGFDLAKQAIQKQEAAFLVEGYTDCIAMVQYGHINTIATLGTACTQEHLQLLSRYAEQLYILYDGDSAGIQAILRVTGLCWQANIDLRVLTLPQGEDPASYLAQQKTIDPLIAQAQDIFAFFIKTISQDFHEKPLKQKLAITRKILGVVAGLKDPLKRDILTQQAAQVVGLPFESIKNELRRIANTQQNAELNQTIPSSEENNDALEQLPTLEKRIFFAIMHNMQWLTEENEDFVLTYLPAPIITIIQKLKEVRAHNANATFDTFFDHLDSSHKQVVTQVLVSFDQPVDDAEFGQLCTQLQKKYWKRIVKDITAKLEQAKESGDKSRVDSILHRFITLKKQMTRGLL